MDTPEPLPRLWRATDLKPAAQPRHLAKGRLIRAAINLLVGDEGIGKSLLWVWIVAAITTGRALPEFGIPARRPQPRCPSSGLEFLSPPVQSPCPHPLSDSHRAGPSRSPSPADSMARVDTAITLQPPSWHPLHNPLA